MTQESVTSFPITYEKKTFLLESVPGCREEQACARYEVIYPVFSGLDTTVARTLQRAIELNVAMGDPDAADKSLEEIGKDFISGYREFSTAMQESGPGWYYQADVDVLLSVDTLLSLIIEEEHYTGGAHGGAATYFININPKKGMQVTLPDIFKTGYEDPLNAIGERLFRKERQLSDTASFRYNDFEFPDDQFKLNLNFGFTEQGIVFVFNSYEVAPYAIGPTKILIPYGKIQDWLNTKPVL
ncbi:MAG TPA: DUF3298 domain-containing protein [Ohtaekwangia sp.]|nr:DUF3298 domain-containing protein [Ohtaekwangia sp.]